MRNQITSRIDVLFVTAVLVLPVAGAFATTKGIGISTKTTTVTFNRATGDIASIVDVASGYNLIAEGKSGMLMSGTLTKYREGKTQRFTAADFRERHISVDNKTITILYKQLKAAPISVTVKVIAGDDDLIAFSADVVNESDWALAELVLPAISMKPDIGGADDALLLPWGKNGVLMQNPGNSKFSEKREYPGNVCAQFLARSGPKAGLFLAVYDSDGYCKQFGASCVPGDSVAFSVTHRFCEKARPALSLSYRAVLTTFAGDWRAAAAIYKKWAVDQPWCQKTLSERADIPKFLLTPIVTLFFPANEKSIGSNLIPLLNDYRAAAGVSNILITPTGWENRGTWAGVNYFPAVPSDEVWSKLNADLKKEGHACGFLVSGFNWVVKRAATPLGPAFNDTAQMESNKNMLVKNEKGEVTKLDYLDQKKPPFHKGLTVMLCHGSETSRETMRDIFLKASALGVTLVSFDQEFGGGQKFPCYDESHGHEPGYGKYMWDGFRDTCISILKSRNPGEIGLMTEKECELTIPYLAAHWGRGWNEIDSPSNNVRGVGLFSYLYHEYAISFGAGGTGGSVNDITLQCRFFANNLVRGLIPGTEMNRVSPQNHPKPGNKEARVASAAFFAYAKPFAAYPDYLLYGECVPPPSMESKTVTYGDSKKIDAPAVIAGSFCAADRSVASFIVNTTPDPQTAVVLRATEKGGVVYSATRKEVQKAGARTELNLEPFGVRVIITK